MIHTLEYSGIEQLNWLKVLCVHLFLCVFRFNFMAYSTEVDKWCTSLVSRTKKGGSDDIMTSAVQWIYSLEAGGNSYLLQAFRVKL